MKKMILAAVAVASMASGANALNLISADVTGNLGTTIWTTRQTGNYTLFVQTPNLGDFINPNDEPINLPINDNSMTRALLAGEGFFPGSTLDSDPIYNLTLRFDGGQTLTGQYTPLTNTFNSGSAFVAGGQSFSLVEFSFRRTLGDSVQPNVATFGGDGNDYSGNFRIDTSAVPEPASWALMIIGFGMVGVSSRRRARATAITA